MSCKEHQPIFEKASRTATTSATLSVESSSGLFFIDVTALTAGASLVFTIAGVSPTNSASVYTILASAAITGTGLTVLRVHPQLTASANLIAKDVLPASLKVTCTAADNKAVTYEMRFVGTE